MQSRHGYIGKTIWALIAAIALALPVAISRSAPAGAATGDYIEVGMPFDGMWAYNKLVPPEPDGSYDDAKSSHPSVHVTNVDNSSLWGDWATDLYPTEANGAVKFKVSSNKPLSLSFQTSYVDSGCGSKVVIKASIANGPSVLIYYEHLKDPVRTGTVTDGMIIGYANNWGACMGNASHVHFELKSSDTNNRACWTGYTNVGDSVIYGQAIGRIESPGASAARTKCGATPATNSLDDIVAVNRRDYSSGKTAVHAINGSNWGQYVLNAASGLPMTDANWDFELGDINSDGTPDIWGFNRNPGGSNTVLHVLDGKNPANYIPGKAGNIVLPGVNANWDFELGFFNSDKVPDIYAINRNSGNGHTAVSVIDGSNWGLYFQRGNIALPVTDANWDFEVGELSGGGKPEIWGFNRNPGGSNTVVHVINGDNWGLYVQAGNIALPGVDSTWNFELGNYDTNGKADIYGINRNPNGSNTVVHVINGSNWGLYHQAGNIVLHGTSADWTFMVGNLR